MFHLQFNLIQHLISSHGKAITDLVNASSINEFFAYTNDQMELGLYIYIFA